MRLVSGAPFHLLMTSSLTHTFTLSITSSLCFLDPFAFRLFYIQQSFDNLTAMSSRSPRHSPVEDRGRSRSAHPSKPLSESRSISRSRSAGRSRSVSRGRTRSRSRSRGARHYDSRSGSRSLSPNSGPPKSSKVGARPVPEIRPSFRGIQLNCIHNQIVVEKLTKNVTEDHVREIFGGFGDIEYLDVPINKACKAHRRLRWSKSILIISLAISSHDQPRHRIHSLLRSRRRRSSHCSYARSPARWGDLECLNSSSPTKVLTLPSSFDPRKRWPPQIWPRALCRPTITAKTWGRTTCGAP